MMHGHEKSDLVIVAMKPANKAKEARCGGDLRGRTQRSRWSEGRGPRGIRTSKHVLDPEPGSRVTGAGAYTATLPSHTRGGSRMRESRTYGSVRGACDETHVPTATSGASSSRFSAARWSWPLAARGQQPGNWRKLDSWAQYSSRPGQWTAAFVQRLRELGWIEGHNVAIDYRGQRDVTSDLRDRSGVRPAQG